MKYGLQPTSLIFLSVALFVVSFGFSQEHRRVTQLRVECDQANRAVRHLHEVQQDLEELEARAAREHVARVKAERRLRLLEKPENHSTTSLILKPSTP